MKDNKIYKAAIYVRLSKEDGDVSDVSKAESNSISNQKELIKEFLKNKQDITVVSERVDDGYSGVSFERPAFQLMLEDIKQGKVDCVVVKDLSRFGRNYIESGRYIEKIFPMLGVRFIAINDNYDSLTGKSQTDEIVIPFKNLINDAYCRDISIKIRSHLDIKRRKGEFIGSFTVYGYRKDGENHNRIAVDEYAAGVVRNIFSWKIAGMSQQGIADRLNDMGVLSPAEYKKSCGSNYRAKFQTKSKATWSAVAVTRILTNENYTGTLIQGKYTIDKQTAPVVKMIFQWYAEGKGLDWIARTLDEMDIDCPRKYRYRIGITTSDRYKDSRWGRSAVKTILTNRAYIGDMVQGKVKQELCNNIVKQYVDKDEWIVAENTHEPVIDRELFFFVQKLLEEKSREQAERREKSGIRGHKEENFLKGYLRCGCCGKSFNLSQTMRDEKITRQYYCSGYQTLRSAFCTNKDRIHKDVLEQIVWQTIQNCILQLMDEKALKGKEIPADSAAEERRIVQVDKEIRQLSGKIADLYKDTAEGILEASDYLFFKENFTKQKEMLEAERKQLLAIVKKSKKKQQDVTVADYLKKCRRSGKLTRQMVETFVDGVKIYGKDRIEVQLLCRDEILGRLEG